jgi:hypothetical protein
MIVGPLRHGERAARGDGGGDDRQAVREGAGEGAHL